VLRNEGLRMPFQKAATLGDLSAGNIVGVEVGGTKVALYLLDGQPVATSDLCTHQECPLSEEGDVAGDVVTCLCHGSRFNIRTGAVVESPATDPLATYAVEVRGEDVLVDVG
jgi:nitrite reductase/ring-hydroxylating ferredoxin subunit